MPAVFLFIKKKSFFLQKQQKSECQEPYLKSTKGSRRIPNEPLNREVTRGWYRTSKIQSRTRVGESDRDCA